MKILNKLFENAGGNLAIYLVKPTNVVSIIKNQTTGISTLTLTGTDDVVQLPVTEDTLALDERRKDEAYQVQIKAFVPGTSLQIDAALEDMARRYWLAVVLDSDGATWRLCGLPETPLKFTYTYATGDAMKKLRGNSISLQGFTKIRSPIINTPF